jgi:hypothetical protein
MKTTHDSLTDPGMDGAARRGGRRGTGALLSMIALGVAGFFAWRNRDRIAATARPMIEDAKVKGRDMVDKAAARSHDMLDQAAVTGHKLVDNAKDKGQALAAKARARREAGDEPPTIEMH